MLISCDASSLVIDRLGDQTRGQGVTVAGIYFDFAVKNEQIPANILDSVLKQVVSGLGDVPLGNMTSI